MEPIGRGPVVGSAASLQPRVDICHKARSVTKTSSNSGRCGVSRTYSVVKPIRANLGYRLHVPKSTGIWAPVT